MFVLGCLSMPWVDIDLPDRFVTHFVHLILSFNDKNKFLHGLTNTQNLYTCDGVPSLSMKVLYYYTITPKHVNIMAGPNVKAEVLGQCCF